MYMMYTCIRRKLNYCQISWWDGSMSKDACHQVWCLDEIPRPICCRKKTDSCNLSSDLYIRLETCVHTNTYTRKLNKSNFKKQNKRSLEKEVSHKYYLVCILIDLWYFRLPVVKGTGINGYLIIYKILPNTLHQYAKYIIYKIDSIYQITIVCTCVYIKNKG